MPRSYLFYPISIFSRRGRKGFTLIELLIVIAIILILIAIALPNFLEAQLRAKATKAKAEIRSLGIAMEQYYMDFKIYPPESEDNPYQRARSEAGLFWLTTPIKYMHSIPPDPFGEQGTGGNFNVYEMGGIEAVTKPCKICLETWAIFTRGPDFAEDQIVSDHPHYGMYDNSVDSYSPTNGTRSSGDIFQFGGDAFWIGVAMGIGMRSRYNPGMDRGLVVDNEFFLHRMPPKLR